MSSAVFAPPTELVAGRALLTSSPAHTKAVPSRSRDGCILQHRPKGPLVKARGAGKWDERRLIKVTVGPWRSHGTGKREDEETKERRESGGGRGSKKRWCRSVGAYYIVHSPQLKDSRRENREGRGDSRSGAAASMRTMLFISCS